MKGNNTATNASKQASKQAQTWLINYKATSKTNKSRGQIWAAGQQKLQTCCTLTLHIYQIMKPSKLILTDLMAYKPDAAPSRKGPVNYESPDVTWCSVLFMQRSNWKGRLAESRFSRFPLNKRTMWSTYWLTLAFVARAKRGLRETLVSPETMLITASVLAPPL